MIQTTLLRRLPPVSSRGTMLLAGVGIICLLLGILAGKALLAPAVAAACVGLGTGLQRMHLVHRGLAYPSEGQIALLAATFVNGSLVLFAVTAGLFVLRFGF